jgi:class 3 adenylate cyclase/CheY-like chemotaxis protein
MAVNDSIARTLAAIQKDPPSPADDITTLRHDLRTLLNHVIGYGEMLIQTAEEKSFPELIRGLDDVCAIARSILVTLNASSAARLTGRHLQTLGGRLLETGQRLTSMIEDLRSLPMVNQDAEIEGDLEKLYSAAKSLIQFANKLAEYPVCAQPEVAAPVAPAFAAVIVPPIVIPQPEIVRPSAQPGSDSRGLLLVVDDNEGNRDMLTRRLQREGYSVVQAEGGHQALRMVREQDFDLVLLDIMMPEIDGMAVLRQMKQDPELKEIPVIMISAVEDTASVVHCLETGAEDFLPKPFNPVILRARVNALMERKRLRDTEKRRTSELEQAIEEAHRQRKIAEDLLLNILPERVAAELRERGEVDPMYFEDATIVFTDFVGFTRSTEELSAEELVCLLHQYFTGFDEIITRYGLEKLKTIGDSYMFASGLPTHSSSHPVDAVLAAFEMVGFVRQMAADNKGPGWQVRIGVHTGPVIAGVVGIRKFAFDVWGDTVNFGSRVESSGAPNRVNLSDRTYSRVKDFFRCEHRGKVKTKEGRDADMYFAESVSSALLKDAAVSWPPPAFRRRYRVYFQKEPRAFPSPSLQEVTTP